MGEKVYNSHQSLYFLFCFVMRGSRTIKKLQTFDDVPSSQLFPSVCVDKVSGTLVILELPHNMCLSVQLLSYFSVTSRHEFIYSSPSWSKARKSGIVESVRQISYKEEKQLFTITVTGVSPRNFYFVYSSAHVVSVSVVDSLMDLNWNGVQHRQGRNKCRNLGSAAVGCLLGSSIWRLIGGVAQDTVS